MKWSYEIKLGSDVIGISSKGFNTSHEAEVDAEIMIKRMSDMSGSLYTYRVFLSELVL